MRHNFTHPTVNESQNFMCAVKMTSPSKTKCISKSSYWSKLLVCWSLEEMGGSMSAQGIFPHATRPKLVTIEASKALFGVTFVYRVLRVITQSQVRARSSHTILSIQSVFIDLLLCFTLDNDPTQCLTRK